MKARHGAWEVNVGRSPPGEGEAWGVNLSVTHPAFGAHGVLLTPEEAREVARLLVVEAVRAEEASS